MAFRSVAIFKFLSVLIDGSRFIAFSPKHSFYLQVCSAFISIRFASVYDIGLVSSSFEGK